MLGIIRGDLRPMNGEYHMRKYLMAASAAGALLAASASAHAALAVAFLDQGTSSTFACLDNAACDLLPSTGNLFMLNTVIGNFSVTGTFAHSATNPDTLIASNVSITNNGSAADTLFFAVADTNYTGGGYLFSKTASGSFNGAGSIKIGYFVDALNTQGGLTGTDTPGVDLFNFNASGLGGLQSFSLVNQVSADLVNSPFAMAEGIALTLNPGATLFSQGVGITAAPEASTWVMAGVGFGLLGLVGVRKSRQARIAA